MIFVGFIGLLACMISGIVYLNCVEKERYKEHREYQVWKNQVCEKQKIYNEEMDKIFKNIDQLIAKSKK